MQSLVQQKRLTVQSQPIAEDTVALRSLDWDRDRFDIEFGLQNGTTYNSFLIKGEKTALIDTSHEKFRKLYLDLLKGSVDPKSIDYLVISHTEPDHSGLVADVLALAPQATVIASRMALQFLSSMVHRRFPQRAVKSGDTLDLGGGHVLEFISAPNLHWPDTMFTFDRGTGVLYTCDAFGMHYCGESLFDEDLAAIEADYRFYYECLMAPNARSVLGALKRMEPLGDIQIVANGHGPLLKFHLNELVERYRRWSLQQREATTSVAVFYVSDYGYSDRLSQAIAQGITKSHVAAELVDLRATPLAELQEIVQQSAGVVIATPPTAGPAAEASQAALGVILANVKEKQTFGVYEACGDSDEPVFPLANRFSDLGLVRAFPPIRLPGREGVREAEDAPTLPTPAHYKLCEESGTDMAQWLTRDRTVQQMKAVSVNLDKAMGRLSGGLYVITARKGDLKSAMLASWVSQTSFAPLGVTIAVAKDRAIEALMQVGDTFVLNVLEEGHYAPLFRHFLKRFAPGEDRFVGVETLVAANGSPILADALAYIECRVASRMETADHWLVYSVVENGRVSNLEGVTAVHHRKVGNHY
ncbi:diflavin flavoprotein [Gloeobacter kilaueensis]|uniref:Flavoprotein n=1 Tax=Gloeobacter kilaueensis (strain ATCC BAA-2537 / CCAP 1431/1 / ULC 316 / JS1) TaxID=1183438 RepID=U5QIW2_GLOK1|nr:diflavin flavoprotein [Gloeobacter kilaueensis]AGY57630.1 flavoprotein [Gloeobacter kilaueensis JS1]